MLKNCAMCQFNNSCSACGEVVLQLRQCWSPRPRLRQGCRCPCSSFDFMNQFLTLKAATRRATTVARFTNLCANANFRRLATLPVTAPAPVRSARLMIARATTAINPVTFLATARLPRLVALAPVLLARSVAEIVRATLAARLVGLS